MKKTKGYRKSVNHGWVKFSSSNIWHRNSKSGKKQRKKIVLLILGAIILIWVFWFSKNVIQGLPDVSQINNMVFSEATIIEDRNGKELYKLYEENREYVPFSWISENMINALVAMEDQRYWEHNWLDPMGILRAWISNVLNPWWGMQGASTIPQQLLKNLLLNKDLKRETFQEKVIRKLRELLLTWKLNSVLEKEIKKEQPKINKDDLHKAMKDKVLELYLNYIAFWNNAFGIEAASKTYFSKSAKDLDVLESSILASIPKSPTIYNPYKNRQRVIWGINIVDNDWQNVSETENIEKLVAAALSKKLDAMDIQKDGSFISIIENLWSISVTDSGSVYSAKYVIWRKDYALMRMYEEWYITQNELKQSFLQWISYQLRKNRVEMLAPHFVQWIIEELEKKYDKDTLFKWWIVIKTTLDLDVQKEAETALRENMSVLQQNWANNSSMIYLDSKNGDILAYVWSIDYFDDKIQWQNDMVRSYRQSWSAIKPFIYALGFQRLALTLDTPIFDIPFEIGEDKPNNADDKFSWLLPLKYALAHSRNIPATKMITALWWEAIAKPYLMDLWLSWVKKNIEYGYTLALWAAEITMMELANAYMHLSISKPAEINPILEIRSRDGSLIYQKEVEKQQEVIPPGIWYLIWNILSDPANRLAWWVSKFNVPWLSLWLKTGTSNAKTSRGNRPRDGWLATYNGSKVALFWAGNADGTPMNRNAFGGTIHAGPMKSFFTSLVKNNYITNDTIKSVDTTPVSISKITWKIANENTPSEFVVSTLRYNRWIALEEDWEMKSFEYDSLCNGAQSQNTPLDSLKKWYVIQPTTIIPSKMDLNDITMWRKEWSSFTWDMPEWWFVSWNITYNYPNIFIEAPVDPCNERWAKEDTDINIDVMNPTANDVVSNKFSLWYSVNAQRGLKSVLVFADDKQIAQFSYNGKNKYINDLTSVSSDLNDWEHNIRVVVVDAEWYSNTKTFDIEIVTKDSEAPFILEDKTKVQKLENGKYQVNIILDDKLSYIEYGRISIGEKTVFEFDWKAAVFTLDQISPVTVLAKDAYGNIMEEDITLHE